MPRLIFKCPYLKGGSHTTVQRENYLRYIATREGVELLPEHPDWPATQKQKELIQQLNQDFPSTRTLFEYEDYRKFPTRKNAAELIDRVLEDHFLSASGKKRYMEYIAQRPRVVSLPVGIVRSFFHRQRRRCPNIPARSGFRFSRFGGRTLRGSVTTMRKAGGSC